jgi:hypothetical protein
VGKADRNVRRQCELWEHSQPMKQINVFPMLMMLIVVVVLIAWLGGYLS